MQHPAKSCGHTTKGRERPGERPRQRPTQIDWTPPKILNGLLSPAAALISQMVQSTNNTFSVLSFRWIFKDTKSAVPGTWRQKDLKSKGFIIIVLFILAVFNLEKVPPQAQDLSVYPTWIRADGSVCSLQGIDLDLWWHIIVYYQEAPCCCNW